MTDGIRKRHEARARYDAALESWHRSSAACPACHDTLTIQHEEGSPPCPYCQPNEARAAAAREATP